MNEFLRAAYGDPCGGCGYEWSPEPTACTEVVRNAPARFRALNRTGNCGGSNSRREDGADAYPQEVPT